jgi:hypothetical protein
VTEDAHHDAATHADTHAAANDHASVGHDDHGEPRLGPVDWQAWFYAVVGFAAGLLVVGVFWLKT